MVSTRSGRAIAAPQPPAKKAAKPKKGKVQETAKRPTADQPVVKATAGKKVNEAKNNKAQDTATKTTTAKPVIDLDVTKQTPKSKDSDTQSAALKGKDDQPVVNVSASKEVSKPTDSKSQDVAAKDVVAQPGSKATVTQPNLMSRRERHEAELANYQRIAERRTPSISVGQNPIPTLPSPRAISAARAVDNVHARRKGVEPCGLDYDHQTCYRNSVLIALVCDDSFMAFVRQYWIPHRSQSRIQHSDGTDYLRGAETHPFGVLNRVWENFWKRTVELKSLQNLVENQWVKLVKLTNGQEKWFVHGEEGKHFGDQRDVADFLNWMFGAEEIAFPGSAQSKSDATTLLRNVLAPTFTEYRSCARCEQKVDHRQSRFRTGRVTQDYLWSLGLPPDHGESYDLADLISRDFKAPSDAWFCSDCEAATTQAQRTIIGAAFDGPTWRYVRALPETLFMQLNRFEYKFSPKTRKTTARKSKLKVHIPQIIDLDSYLDPDSSMEEREKIDSRYDLVGVIAHKGSLALGHYINYTLVDRQWYKIDGKGVEYIDFHDINDEEDFTPYLLVWQRKIEADVEAIGSLVALDADMQKAAVRETATLQKDATDKVSPHATDGETAAAKSPSKTPAESPAKTPAQSPAKTPTQIPSKAATPSKSPTQTSSNTRAQSPGNSPWKTPASGPTRLAADGGTAPAKSPSKTLAQNPAYSPWRTPMSGLKRPAPKAPVKYALTEPATSPRRVSTTQVRQPASAPAALTSAATSTEAMARVDDLSSNYVEFSPIRSSLTDGKLHEGWLRVKVAFSDQVHWLHHRIEHAEKAFGANPASPVEVAAHLVDETSNANSKLEWDLIAASTNNQHNLTLASGVQVPHSTHEACTCGVVHESECDLANPPSSKRKHDQSAQDDDASSSPTSAKRLKTQAKMDQILSEWNAKWKDWKPPQSTLPKPPRKYAPI